MPLSKDTITNGWLNDCDLHSELVQLSILPLCASALGDIHLLQQASSARLAIIDPPVENHATALWHLLTCHCCQGNLYLEAASFSGSGVSVQTENMMLPIPLHFDWRFNGPAVFMLSQLSLAWFMSLPRCTAAPGRVICNLTASVQPYVGVAIQAWTNHGNTSMIEPERGRSRWENKTLYWIKKWKGSWQKRFTTGLHRVSIKCLSIQHHLKHTNKSTLTLSKEIKLRVWSDTSCWCVTE